MKISPEGSEITGWEVEPLKRNKEKKEAQDIVWPTGAPCLVSHHLSGQRLGCRTTDVGGPRQDRPSGAEADRSGV